MSRSAVVRKALGVSVAIPSSILLRTVTFLEVGTLFYLSLWANEPTYSQGKGGHGGMSHPQTSPVPAPCLSSLSIFRTFSDSPPTGLSWLF